MKWYNFAPPRDKEKIELDNSSPALKKQDIVAQALICLHQSGVKWVPYITEEQLVAQTDDSKHPKFVFMPVQLIYSSAVLNSTHPAGSPLPHPVDGSFIFMVACAAGASIESFIDLHKEKFKEARQQKETDETVDDILDDDFTTYLKQKMHNSTSHFMDDDTKSSKLTFSLRTFIGFILYHYTRVSTTQSKVSPKYSNISTVFLFYSNLIVKKISRGVFQLQSLNEVFRIYQKLKQKQIEK